MTRYKTSSAQKDLLKRVSYSRGEPSGPEQIHEDTGDHYVWKVSLDDEEQGIVFTKPKGHWRVGGREDEGFTRTRKLAALRLLGEDIPTVEERKAARKAEKKAEKGKADIEYTLPFRYVKRKDMFHVIDANGTVAASRSREQDAKAAITKLTKRYDQPLPEDFPGQKALLAAEINSFAALRDMEDVEAVSGIGPATAKAIAEALGA